LKTIYPEEVVELMQLHYSRLSEKDRRQYAAIEALKLGRGGTNYISRLLLIDKKILIQGKRELKDPDLYRQIPADKQRRPGGGRKKNERQEATG
jgi:hypothetical protein